MSITAQGEEADRDADFVRSLCEGFHVPCHILKVDVRGLAAEKGMSEEEAGRFLRYEALEREAADWEDEDRTGPDGGSADSSVRPVKIAVAHHSGDQVETILHNLFRGSGLSGMKGIVYRRGGLSGRYWTWTGTASLSGWRTMACPMCRIPPTIPFTTHGTGYAISCCRRLSSM